MALIREGKYDPGKDPNGRGKPPKHVAQKYREGGKGLPEQSGENRGGTWGHEQHIASHSKEAARHSAAGDKEKAAEHHKKAARHHRALKEEQKKRVKKSAQEALEAFYKGQGVGLIVTNPEGKILIGKQKDGNWATPGGHVEPGESFEDAAKRELREETGLDAKGLKEVHKAMYEGNHSTVFEVEGVHDPKTMGRDVDGELEALKWVLPTELPDNMRRCSTQGILAWLKTHNRMSKSLVTGLAIEKLEKNILRGADGRDAVFEMTHGDALKLIGTGTFRMLKRSVEGMNDEDFREVNIGEYKLHIRKHLNDVYSGRIEDGHKLVHQFQNRSLPQLAAELMSVFEWYHPEDEQLLDDPSIDDLAIEGGINALMANYKRHNIGEIYSEMERIRSEMREGAAVDVQQAEARIMKLFDKLEKLVHEAVGKHNQLSRNVSEDIEDIQHKLVALQGSLEAMNVKPQTIEAYSQKPVDGKKLHAEMYPYLSKPQIEISPDGRIRISFGSDWTGMEKEDFLNDMKAKVIRKK